MGIRSKAAHLVSDLTTVLLNPISDKPVKPSSVPHPEPETEPEGSKAYSTSDEDSEDSGDGPDTSSFTAFLVSLLSNPENDKHHPKPEVENIFGEDVAEASGVPILRDSGRKKSIFSKGKQSLTKIYHATRFAGFRNSGAVKSNIDMVFDKENNPKVSGDEEMSHLKLDESLPSDEVIETSEPSLLLSEKTRNVLFASMPVIVQGRKWILLYSTWRHGISISTLYRRSMLWPGLSLLVVGDRKGAVFGGLVEAPLRPTNKRRYQGSNNTFVFTNVSGDPTIFRSTGVNRYFTLCSTEYLALGGGNHFALYLDGDLLSGSSSASDTYGNSCLAHTQDFEVKEVELWGFVYASKYEEMVAALRTEAPGISSLVKQITQ
ncbi:OLC1v1009262C3 [Oldenlandia corymbosa var. corymbosa]|uniref:Oxidation resistance protein 1 n=1 Tax=Oldenlandia corymbosa var. corymbosa TaxID=529605 RepID=A0AAV1DRT5_OLDCO|nr:OLC1v1009262C3 [Oldenlandia corymbosa var. corymbosa]